jgi:hypothetical protein
MRSRNYYGDYDTCRLIREQQPKIISDFDLDPVACGLSDFYVETQFPKVYLRKPEIVQ